MRLLNAGDRRLAGITPPISYARHGAYVAINCHYDEADAADTAAQVETAQSFMQAAIDASGDWTAECATARTPARRSTSRKTPTRCAASPPRIDHRDGESDGRIQLINQWIYASSL
ncbi:hypothetical protein [Caulobacter sp. 602-1]|uniref:hypothetical protein n=1 Tax=Caulobacter sp. 602-1 TaxID=2492472 RepID=UPI000F6304F0|nr:hypothetical protein [Caulobacter sp. 602-1]RRN64003.1 hypothetical protein EIK80_14690 [Caulobacter sp. 602-1]